MMCVCVSAHPLIHSNIRQMEYISAHGGGEAHTNQRSITDWCPRWPDDAASPHINELERSELHTERHTGHLHLRLAHWKQRTHTRTQCTTSKNTI